MSKQDKEAVKQFTKQPMEKKKELRYAKDLQKDKEEGSSTAFHFDVLDQLANILARITLYEFLGLFKSMREALREALVNSDAFKVQILADVKRRMKNFVSKPSSIFPA